MDWFYLFVAGIFEIGWSLGLKLSQMPEMGNRNYYIIMIIFSMTFSSLFLWLAQRSISMGTAYAVWTGIGTAGTFILGIWLLKDQATVLRIMSVLLIIIGIAGLKLSH